MLEHMDDRVAFIVTQAGFYCLTLHHHCLTASAVKCMFSHVLLDLRDCAVTNSRDAGALAITTGIRVRRQMCINNEPVLACRCLSASRANTLSRGLLLFMAVTALETGAKVRAAGAYTEASAELGLLERSRYVEFPFGNNLTFGEPLRIAVTMPITSRGDVEGGVAAMRIFSSFLPSFIATAFPTDIPCTFEFWFAYDAGDLLLDTPKVFLWPLRIEA